MGKVGRPKTRFSPEDEIIIECVKCQTKKTAGEFFLSKWSKVYNANAKRVPVCKDCMQSLMDEYTKQYDEKTALAICCAFLDLPYYPELYLGMITRDNPFNIGNYVKQLQMRQYQSKSFRNTIVEGELSKDEFRTKDSAELKWSKEDKRNKNYVISTVGYDPFENCGMTDDDRRYCFNILSSYCDIDGVKDDGHKMISCVQIAQSQLQVHKLDEIINQELLNVNPDDSKIKSFTESKKKLQDSITKMASENSISAKASGKHNKNAFTQKMKEMSEDGYEPARPNLFDIKTAESFKQVAAISAQCIADQLAFDDSDYSEMVKEQREAITTLREKNEILEEENRNLKNELFDLKCVGKKKG